MSNLARHDAVLVLQGLLLERALRDAATMIWGARLAQPNLADWKSLVEALLLAKLSSLVMG